MAVRASQSDLTPGRRQQPARWSCPSPLGGTAVARWKRCPAASDETGTRFLIAPGQQRRGSMVTRVSCTCPDHTRNGKVCKHIRPRCWRASI